MTTLGRLGLQSLLSRGEFHVAPDFEFKFENSGQVLNRGVATSLLTVE